MGSDESQSKVSPQRGRRAETGNRTDGVRSPARRLTARPQRLPCEVSNTALLTVLHGQVRGLTASNSALLTVLHGQVRGLTASNTALLTVLHGQVRGLTASNTALLTVLPWIGPWSYSQSTAAAV